MPPEYCEYGPDYETHCLPWMQKYQPDIDYSFKNSKEKKDQSMTNNKSFSKFTTEQRLIAFYTKYQPDMLGKVKTIMLKYSGREDKLFLALVKKYGPEPTSLFDQDISSVNEDVSSLSVSSKIIEKRRGASARKVEKVDTRIIIQKISRNRKKAVTVIIGLDTVPSLKLKEVAKEFSKRFAGSSSVKDTAVGRVSGNGGGRSRKEIILQGDHVNDVAIIILKNYGVDKEKIFLDIDGEIVPFDGERR